MDTRTAGIIGWGVGGVMGLCLGVVSAALGQAPLIREPAQRRELAGAEVKWKGAEPVVEDAPLKSRAPESPATIRFAVPLGPGGAEIQAQALLNIAGAKRSVHLLAFELTDGKIVDALIGAQRRKVGVAVVMDWRRTAGKHPDKACALAYARLRDAGVPVWTLKAPGIMHEKVLICDGDCLSGSYNFTAAAARLNYENSREDIAPKTVAQYEANFAALLKAAQAQAQPAALLDGFRGGTE